MAWDQTKPSNNEKIRDLGTVTRANWVAIEENDSGTKSSSLNQWVVHLVDRATVGGINTPAPVDNTGLVYCRNDGAENELFFEDSAATANEVQLTQGGKIGSTTTPVVAQNVAFGSVATTYAAPNIISVYGRFTSSGSSTLSSFGCTISNVSINTARVTFTTPRSNANYIVVSVQNLDNFGFKTSVISQATTDFVIAFDGASSIVNFMVCGDL